MKKICIACITFIILSVLTSCRTSEEIILPDTMQEKGLQLEPNIIQMQNICELAVMECLYHNVTVFHQEDAEKFLFWTKDKDLWIEYDSTIELGFDASLLQMKIDGLDIEIIIPEAQLLNYHIDANSMNFYTRKQSADLTTEDTAATLAKAKQDLYTEVSNNKELLQNAQDRAKSLLEDYINNIGNLIGKQYTIQWKYCDASGNIIR